MQEVQLPKVVRIQFIAGLLRKYSNPRLLGSFFSKRHSDRGQERYRRASLAASASVLGLGLNLIINFVSVPLTIHYLGPERYGVWLTLSSLMMWMTMTDFGLTGNALINLISEANGRDDRDLARQYASSTFWTLITIVAGLGVLFAAAFTRIPWRAVFRVSDVTSSHELQTACALAVLLFLVTIPLNMLNSLYNAYQDGFVSNLWNMAGNLAALVALIAVTRFRGGLPQLVFAMSGTRVLTGLVNAYYLFFRRYPWLAPSPLAIRWAHIKRMLRLSSKYMLAQISALGIGQSQPMIITQVLGPAYVPIFVVANRLFNIPTNIVFIGTVPLISAYGEAKARADWKWIKGAVRNSTIIGVAVASVIMIGLAVESRPIIQFWAGAAVVPSPALVLWFCLYNVLQVALTPASQMLWGLERVGVQAFGLALCAVATITLSLLLGKLLGLTGVAAAMTFGYAICCAIQSWEVRRALRDVRLDWVRAEACAPVTTSA
jgi:O-antigen/teichoic acid export membrane protein